MISEQEAQQLMTRFVFLRDSLKKKPNKEYQKEYVSLQRTCIDKFTYLVSMRTNRYKGFSNYDDLNQEGFEALLKAMANYNPNKGSWFWWCHKYIDTRIARSANLHTAIRFPLKFARKHTPHKESTFPLMIETRFNPDKILEDSQLQKAVDIALKNLDAQQKEIVCLAFGFTGEKPLSINKICKQKSISRMNCVKVISTAMQLIKENIKL